MLLTAYIYAYPRGNDGGAVIRVRGSVVARHNRGWSSEAAQRAEDIVEAVWIKVGLFFDTEGGSLTQLYLAASPEVEAKVGSPAHRQRYISWN